MRRDALLPRCSDARMAKGAIVRKRDRQDVADDDAPRADDGNDDISKMPNFNTIRHFGSLCISLILGRSITGDPRTRVHARMRACRSISTMKLQKRRVRQRLGGGGL